MHIYENGIIQLEMSDQSVKNSRCRRNSRDPVVNDAKVEEIYSFVQFYSSAFLPTLTLVIFLITV